MREDKKKTSCVSFLNDFFFLVYYAMRVSRLCLWAVILNCWLIGRNKYVFQKHFFLISLPVKFTFG